MGNGKGDRKGPVQTGVSVKSPPISLDRVVEDDGKGQDKSLLDSLELTITNNHCSLAGDMRYRTVGLWPCISSRLPPGRCHPSLCGLFSLHGFGRYFDLR